MPSRAPVATMSVTIDPGVRNSMIVINRKAENRCQFIIESPSFRGASEASEA